MVEPRRLTGVVLLLFLAAPVAAWPASRDRDHDGLPDRWERRYHFSTQAPTAKRDPDRDRLSNRREFRLRTNPRRADTDRDGLRDGAEVKRYRTNPRRADTDGDDYRDGAEVRAGTNPRDPASHPGPSAKPAPTAPAAAGPAPAAPTPSPTPVPIHCDRKTTPTTFDAQLSAASAGQTICLATGDYGIWHGIDKAVTVRPQADATPHMGIHFTTDAAGFTLDGGRASFTQSWGLRLDQDGGSPSIGGDARDITIKDTDFSVGINIEGVTNANILLDHNLHHDLNGHAWSGAVHLSYDADTPSGVTIQKSLFRDMSADGIRPGPAMTILDNEFARIDPLAAGGDDSLHTDAIQPLTGCSGTTGSVIKGNYFHDGEQAIGAFDGTCSMTIEDNVVQNFSAHQITLMGDRPGSSVRHNTIAGTGPRLIDCTSKTGFESSLTSIRDNIAESVLIFGATNCKPSANDHNMLSAANGQNFAGTPGFVGGAHPTTYAGFRLAPGSPGRGRASDGLDVGIR
jgi:hypothetical protein